MAATRWVMAAVLWVASPACTAGGGGDPGDATAVGNPLGEPVTAVIDQQGGALASADGVATLTVPAGAVSSPTELSIQPVENLAPGGVGPAYRLGPEGVTFASPVTLTFRVTGRGTGGALLGLAWQDAHGVWQWMNEAAPDAPAPDTTSVSVPTDHFSPWSLVAGVQLQPLQADVGPKASVSLKVVYCMPLTTERGRQTRMKKCAEAPPLVHTASWSVNGVPGGNGTVGTVQGGNLAATYTAPDKVPNLNEVAVSVEVPPMKAGGAKVVLFSRVTITDGAWLLGTWTGVIPRHVGDDEANPFAGRQLVLDVLAMQDDPEHNPGGLFYSGKVSLDGTAYWVTLPFDASSNPSEIFWDFLGGDGATEHLTVLAGDGSTSFVNFWWRTTAPHEPRPTQLECDWSILQGGPSGKSDSNAGELPQVVLLKQ